MDLQTNTDVQGIIQKLLQKLATAEYNNAVLETKLSEALKENEKSKENGGDN